MRLNNRKFILFKNCLFIFNLGINLLLGKKVIKRSLKNRFNNTEIYYKLSKKKIIRAKLIKKIYIISRIISGFNKNTFIIFMRKLTTENAYNAVNKN